ncbi:hypothetical protein PROFUN_02409 [Planoprotostelium fungivorum]|uniref:Cytidyltransferase-like domain-containing protein n=1 Tax=Planoprotostelium fungivorum TaxID=1890364 RepID=A0A2P6NUR9_9EUKA|nr:hypothetical protein PROFUN_02409 [Planoprotostelium fungivorum]
MAAPTEGKKERAVVLTCGTFSPITYAHLRMFGMEISYSHTLTIGTELAKDYAEDNNIDLLGGYISGVSDAYKKKGMIDHHHRVEMLERATKDSEWIQVDGWEAAQPNFVTTLVVLTRFYLNINRDRKEGESPIQVKLLCGADLLESMSAEGVWHPDDIRDILTRFGLYVIDRAGSDAAKVIESNKLLTELREHITLIPQTIINEISSTKLRDILSRGRSPKYLTPDAIPHCR